jgi:predicted TPR repeat methyltransferase
MSRPQKRCFGEVAPRLKDIDRMLEIGCGLSGPAIRLDLDIALRTATDFSAEMVKVAKTKLSGRKVVE